jgi:hypothetical protein
MPLEDRIEQPVCVLVTWLSVAHPAFKAAHIRKDPDSDMEEDTLEREWEEMELARALAHCLASFSLSPTAEHSHINLPAAPIYCG